MDDGAPAASRPSEPGLAAPQAPAADVPARGEIDPAGAARLVEARLREGASLAGDGFALLLIRLARYDGPRLLLPTAAIAAQLAAIRSRLAGALQEHDRYCVLGPEEILVYLARVKSPSIARLAMSRLMRVLMIPLEQAHGAREVYPAIGGAMPAAHTRSVEQMTAMVDAACQAAREKEDRLHLLIGGVPPADYSELVPDLRAAIESNRLEVHYQPQLDFGQRRCTMVEALVRWPRAAGQETVAPETLVEIACRHGLIQSLTRFVLDTSLREIRDLARSGIELGVSVNLAPVLFADADLPDSIAQSLSVWGVRPEMLTLEVTEASDLRDVASAMVSMGRLQRLGTRLSIDDFGTGYSSLARLRAMPLAELKIDRLFVANMDRSRTDLQIVRSVIDLAHNFELDVVAEGVEHEQTARHLHALGCDVMQGFLLARPMNLAALRDWWNDPPDFAAWMAPERPPRTGGRLHSA